MKKVFLIHGFEGAPNGGWRPWLMAELDKKDVYTSALTMPNPEAPNLAEWLAEIDRALSWGTPDDEIFFVGHSLGVPAILRYLETHEAQAVKGAVLVSGPAHKTGNAKIESFLSEPYNYGRILGGGRIFSVIQGDDDPLVPRADAEEIADGLHTKVLWVPGGKHLNGSAGFHELPQVLTALERMMA